MKLKTIITAGIIALLVLSCGAGGSSKLAGTLWMTEGRSFGGRYISTVTFKDGKTVLVGDEEHEYDFKDGEGRVYFKPKEEVLKYIKQFSEKDAMFGFSPMMAKFNLERESLVFAGNQYKKATQEELTAALGELEKEQAAEAAKYH